jgi:hypothetical protein
MEGRGGGLQFGWTQGCVPNGIRAPLPPRVLRYFERIWTAAPGARASTGIDARREALSPIAAISPVETTQRGVGSWLSRARAARPLDRGWSPTLHLIWIDARKKRSIQEASAST